MDNFSNLMMIGECLLDRRRVNAFERAINKVVKSGDIVLDGGTGSGIMALIAARAGAKKVYAVELDPGICKFAEENVNANKQEKVVTVLEGDMKNLDLPPVDVVIMEMMDTGMIAEQQLQAINNLITRGIIHKNTKVIPDKFETFIQFSRYDFDFYGFSMPFIVQARNFGVVKKINNKLSNPIRINNVSLTEYNNEEFIYEGSVEFLEDGLVNSFIITSRIRLAKGVYNSGTTDLNMPVIVPVESINATKSMLKKFWISYRYGHGFSTLDFHWLS